MQIFYVLVIASLSINSCNSEEKGNHKNFHSQNSSSMQDSHSDLKREMQVFAENKCKNESDIKSSYTGVSPLFNCYSLQAHNFLRHKKGLVLLQYNEELARNIYKWFAENRIFAHSNSQYRKNAGENIAMLSGTALKECNVNIALDQVWNWYSEIKDYNKDSNKCARGKMCGHYTQVMWNKTTNVGCSAYYIPIGKGGKCLSGCQYSPPGNYVGQKPF